MRVIADEVLAGTGWVEAGTYIAILGGTIVGGLTPPHIAIPGIVVVAVIVVSFWQSGRVYLKQERAIAQAKVDIALHEDAIAEYGRPMYEKLIASAPIELPLPAAKLVAAFRRWDEEIGSRKGK